MIGTIEEVEFTMNSFGQQYTTIDGQRHITYFNILDENLAGLERGCRVEYELEPAPTILCHSPWVEKNLPYARLLRVIGGPTS